MENKFWGIYYILLFAIIFCCICIIFGTGITIREFVKKGKDLKKCITIDIISIIFVCFFTFKFVPYFKDAEYVKSNNYIITEVIVEEFTYSKIDADGNGELEQKNPKVTDIFTGEEIILDLKDDRIKIGKTYKIKYLPNTKLAEIIEGQD